MDDNQQPEVSSPSPVVAPPKSKSSLLFIVLGIFFLIFFSIGSFYLGQRNQTTNNQVVPTVSILPTVGSLVLPTPNETTNWKTYINTKYAYTFQYPYDWYLNDDKDETITILTNTDPNTYRPGHSFFSNDLKIEVYSDKPEFIEIPSQNAGNIISFAGQKVIQTEEDLSQTIPGNKKVTVHIKRIYFDRTESRYGVFLYLADPTLEQEKLVDQILSTFTFK
ncbi:hypothetical protein HY357_02880 [Candidatus Roizmanbacteria bacterium]|nr:hypothetical protein [Candidatus Roizmanbacteria bacterium]